MLPSDREYAPAGRVTSLNLGRRPMRILSVMLMLLVFVIILGGNCRAQTAPDTIKTNSFPSIVERMKCGIACVEVGTNIKNVTSKGTAFILFHGDGIGLLVTCRHVFRDLKYKDTAVVADLDSISVTFHDTNRPFKAVLLKEEQTHDVAILGMILDKNTKDSLKLIPVELEGTSAIIEGTEIACTGYNLMLDTVAFGRHYQWASTHKGIISCKKSIGPAGGPTFTELFRTDMIFNKGISGSPVYLAENGRVVGMAAGGFGIATDNAGNLPFGESYCIPLWAISKQIAALVDSAMTATRNLDTMGQKK